MEIIASPTEQTTAATDIVLGVLAIYWALRVYRAGSSTHRQKATIWAWAFGLLAYAALQSCINHGLVWDRPTYLLLWHPVNLALGMAVGCFVLGTWYDYRSKPVSKGLIIGMMSAGAAFFLITLLLPNSFLGFIIYEGLAMLFSLGLYATLAKRKKLHGATIVSLGIALNMVAALVQALGSGKIHFTLIWEFDHNGLFHIIQWISIMVMGLGLLKTYKTTSE
ncbi:MAG TPA: hypothetical protein DCE41_24820 [Cytophagales bacterium]|nr:hypothetical protein [Cytophagales bacterium]HAA23240.1 hypothetical protein [Cytophagales bacterium]HAP58470.1 hypothetical protein [Cytophagales bacterium]